MIKFIVCGFVFCQLLKQKYYSKYTSIWK